MTNRVAKAKIHWIPPAANGRKAPPTGSEYSTVARFEADVENWQQVAWSIILTFDELPNDSLDTTALIRFLAPDAPAHYLEPGNRFELFEGRRLVAKGEVVG